jgi:hypothetical protein
MDEELVLINPENIFKIISYEDLKNLRVVDNDELTLFFVEIDTLLKEAWTKRFPKAEYDITNNQKYTRILTKELHDGGYTFILKDIKVENSVRKFIIIDVCELTPP